MKARETKEKVPSRDECFRLMEEHGMLSHIVAHSIEVTNVALFLSLELNDRGQNIDLQVVEAASLLHDIAKTLCLRTKEDHTRAGCDLLKEKGYERVGRIVAQHVWLAEAGQPLSVSEEEIVNYADKRVRHDQIVSLAERFDDLKKRYGKDQRSIDYLARLGKLILEIENKIFLILKVDPNDLQVLIQNRAFGQRLKP